MTVEQLAAEKRERTDKRRYCRIRYEGSSCTVEPAERDTMLEGLEGATVEDVWMTKAEFEALPEFQGW